MVTSLTKCSRACHCSDHTYWPWKHKHSHPNQEYESHMLRYRLKQCRTAAILNFMFVFIIKWIRPVATILITFLDHKNMGIVTWVKHYMSLRFQDIGQSSVVWRPFWNFLDKCMIKWSRAFATVLITFLDHENMGIVTKSSIIWVSYTKI